jgi:hypothetical protein
MDRKRRCACHRRSCIDRRIHIWLTRSSDATLRLQGQTGGRHRLLERCSSLVTLAPYAQAGYWLWQASNLRWAVEASPQRRGGATASVATRMQCAIAGAGGVAQPVSVKTPRPATT